MPSPWTIFAFPSRIADEHGLPRDVLTLRLLDALRQKGLQVELWSHPEISDTIYFAVDNADRDFAARCIGEFEQTEFGSGFFTTYAETLFARKGDGVI